MSSGLFVAIEGIDGSGTTTHTKLLTQWLKKQGIPVLATNEPTNREIGQVIRRILRDPTIPAASDALLFAADRVDHTYNIINPALEQNKVVVSDRYVESSIAYQSSSGLSIDWVIQINQYAITPNLTILLDLAPEVALKRKRNPDDAEKFETIPFLKKVRQVFLTRANEQDFAIINSEPRIQQVQRLIQKHITPLLTRLK